MRGGSQLVDWQMHDEERAAAVKYHVLEWMVGIPPQADVTALAHSRSQDREPASCA